MKKYTVISIILAIVAVLVLSVALTACVNDDTPEETPTTYVVMAPDGAPAMAIARLMQTNAKIGNHTADYRLINGNVVASSMMGGEADFIIAPTNAGVQLAIVTGNYRLMATTSWGNLFIVTTDTTIKTLDECDSAAAFLAQLAGKSVSSIGNNQVPDVSLRHLLTTAEVADVTVAAAGDASVIQTGLKDGSVTIGVLGEPAATATTKSNADVRIVASVSDLWNELVGVDFAQASVFVKKSIIETDPDAVRAFATALQSSIAYLNTGKEQATELGNYMQERGDSTLKGAIVGLSYVNMRQRYASAQDSKAAVVEFVTVLGVPYQEATHSDIFWLD